MEEWKLVDGTFEEGHQYYVSKCSKVKLVLNDEEILLTQTRTTKGNYLTVGIKYTNRVKKRKRVHVLVALAFVDNPENKPQVDHIDQNTRNNHASNLRWSTGKEQAANKSPRKLGVKKFTKKDCFYILSKKGKWTADKLAQKLGRNADSISKVWRGVDIGKSKWREEYLNRDPANKHLFV